MGPLSGFGTYCSKCGINRDRLPFAKLTRLPRNPDTKRWIELNWIKLNPALQFQLPLVCRESSNQIIRLACCVSENFSGFTSAFVVFASRATPYRFHRVHPLTVNNGRRGHVARSSPTQKHMILIKAACFSVAGRETRACSCRCLVRWWRCCLLWLPFGGKLLLGVWMMVFVYYETAADGKGTC